MMGGGYVTNAGVFLVDVLFGLYIFAVLLRLILQLVRADFYHPLCQAIVKVTNPPLRPLRRYIPAVGTVDTASVVLVVVLQMANTVLIALMLGASLAPAGLLVLAVAALLDRIIWIFMGAIIIEVIMSWVGQGSYNPLMDVVHSLTWPLMRPARRLLPPLGGLDLSPMLVIVMLQLVRMLVVAPIRDAGLVLL